MSGMMIDPYQSTSFDLIRERAMRDAERRRLLHLVQGDRTRRDLLGRGMIRFGQFLERTGCRLSPGCPCPDTLPAVPRF
jgi:hypothetical protein